MLTGPSPNAIPSRPSASPAPDNRIIDAVTDWLKASKVSCLPLTLVPGTTTSERKHLAALGGIARSIIGPTAAFGRLPVLVRNWMNGAPAPPPELVDRVRHALRIDGSAFLGRIYEAVVQSSHRRALGTYFTPNVTVDWMLAEWSAKERPPRSVVDVGAGVGVFTTASLAAWKPNIISAIDVNPVTLGLLGMLFTAVEQPAWGTNMVLEDYTMWKGHALQPAPCLTIGNPPYTRLQLLDKKARARMHEDLPDCGTRAGLSTWIVSSAFSRLRKQDGLLFLLPRNWMEAEYAIALRSRLWGAQNRRVELTNLAGDIFGDARIDAVVLLVGAEKAAPQPFLLRQSPSDPGKALLERSGPVPSFVRYDRLQGSPRTREESLRATHLETVPLSTLATVRRGTATGANEYFTLSDETLREWRLPPSCTRALVRRLRDLPKDRIAPGDLAALGREAPRWLLHARAKQAKRGAALQRFLQHGQEIGVTRRLLCRRRSPWYDLTADIYVPDVIVGPMSREKFRFVENAAHAAITNNLFGLTWASHVTTVERIAILAWLRGQSGQAALRAVSRTHAGGLHKLEPRALGALRVPIKL
jgi:adenine-specific DNA-methyltransferase